MADFLEGLLRSSVLEMLEDEASIVDKHTETEERNT